ncbi:hypothetical protein [Thiolinea disciformis]|uniref:hypothetical protein n=1 Tax=Thiolinea disciformis TaxID=125614 RepID=UPI0003769F18|nr:hypothetical protein [Thiolinea disciformis]
MDQSLSITVTLEGGLPNLYLSVQDSYYSSAQIFNVPLEFVDIPLLVNSAQHPGDHWMITASPDNMRFQIESAVFVRHQEGKIHWDLVFEHYDPFLNIELEDEIDDGYEENLISFSFDPFQYVSALYQASLLCQQLQPATFTPSEDQPENPHPVYQFAAQAPRLKLLWQLYGKANGMVAQGEPTKNYDHFAQEAETQWLQDLLDTLDSTRQESILENLDAYLESLPEEELNKLENNGKQLEEMLIKRWEKLVDSLTEEEADALENDQTRLRFPNSLKLRLMREFLEGNPSVLLGSGRDTAHKDENVVDLQHWKRNHPTDSSR